MYVGPITYFRHSPGLYYNFIDCPNWGGGRLGWSASGSLIQCRFSIFNAQLLMNSSITCQALYIGSTWKRTMHVCVWIAGPLTSHLGTFVLHPFARGGWLRFKETCKETAWFSPLLFPSSFHGSKTDGCPWHGWGKPMLQSTWRWRISLPSLCWRMSGTVQQQQLWGTNLGRSRF